MASPENFALAIHHEGKYVDIGESKFYHGGKITSRYSFDLDTFGYFDLRDEIRALGYHSWKSLAYKIPGHDYVLINDDKETTEMLSHLVTREIGVLHIYVEHDSSDKGDNSEGLGFSHNFGEGQTSNGCNGDESDDDDGEYMPDEDEYGADSDLCVSLDDELTEVGGVGELGELESALNIECDVDEGALSDYLDEDLAMYDTTDEECESGRKRSKKVYYDPKCDHRNMELVLGMRFEDGLQARDGLRNWAICHGHPIQFRKATKKTLVAKCVKPCEWKCYGSVNSSENYFVIRNLPHDHTCPFAVHNKIADYKWIGSQYVDDFRVRPDMSIPEFLDDCNRRFGVQPTRGRLYRAKQYALELLRGTVVQHYGLLRNYVAELIRVDRMGRFELLLGEGSIFKGLYIGFSALKKGFMVGCRKLLGLDGCHLKTHLGGQLLCATAFDANNQMFPVAWAVVGVENEFYWTWFLRILLEELGMVDGNGFTFMSDQQKGLVNAVANVAPHAEHRNCARHVYSNWKKAHKGSTLMNLFWKAVRCTYQQEFELAMEEMKEEDLAAYEDFMERGPAKICKVFFSTHCVSDSVTNNISETFNGTIVKARGKHIIHMLEDIRRQLRSRQYLKLEKMNKVTDVLCPRIRKRLEELKQWARYCSASPGLGGVFEVMHKGDVFTVSLGNRSCSCRSWDLTGLPCVHGLSAIHFMKEDATAYVNHYFTVEEYKKTYSFGLPALNGEKMWPKANGNIVQPPEVAAMPGRPKKKRRKARDETDPKKPQKLRRLGVRMTCQNCHQVGHNRLGCKEPEREKVQKQPGQRGRPRKNPAPQTTGAGTARQPPVTSSQPSEAASSQPIEEGHSRPKAKAAAEQRAMNKNKRQARQGIGLFIPEDGVGNAYYHGSMGPGSVLQEVGASTRSKTKQPLRRGRSASQP